MSTGRGWAGETRVSLFRRKYLDSGGVRLGQKGKKGGTWF